jgi:hypothetical protein
MAALKHGKRQKVAAVYIQPEIYHLSFVILTICGTELRTEDFWLSTNDEVVDGCGLLEGTTSQDALGFAEAVSAARDEGEQQDLPLFQHSKSSRGNAR